MLEGTAFFPFPKPGRLRKDMTKWEQDDAKKRTDGAKRWLNASGRKDLANRKKIMKGRYIFSLHFENPSGPTEKSRSNSCKVDGKRSRKPDEKKMENKGTLP